METAKRKIRLPGVFLQEMVRVAVQPWFWVSIVGCIVLRMLCIFGTEDTYERVFLQGNQSVALLGLLYNRFNSFLSYVPYCLCAFPFVGNYVQDKTLNRIEFMVPRSGCLNYAAAQVMVVFVGASICMFVGDAAFLLVGHFGLGLPFETGSFTGSSLQASGCWLGYWLATELQVCMQAVFYALLAMMVSFVVADVQFVTVLPMVFLYFTMYFFTWDAVPIPRWLEPKGIYMHNWGMFVGDDIAQCMYALFFTVLVAAAAAVLLYYMLKRQVRG